MKKKLASVVLAVAALAFAAGAIAQGPPKPRTERVQFPKGASVATIKGTQKGDRDVDYLVRAAAGQTLEVSLAASHPQTYFNVLPPGSDNVAMYIAQDGKPYRGVLPADGDYRIRVYLMRPAARRNETSNYTLTLGVTGKPLSPVVAAKDALVKGTPYNATAQVSCVPPYASAPAQCDAGVIRRGDDGTATVELRSKGSTLVRRILFVAGKPVASDAAEALSSARQGDVTQVKIAPDERYDIPDAFLRGG